MKIVGIDLAGVQKKQTGFAILYNDMKVDTEVLYRDEEIINKSLEVKPDIITIDAPLGLPKGRCCLDYNCECAKHGHTRKAERLLMKMGIRIFPCGFAGMQKLTMRGIKLRELFENKGYKVIETYPGSAQDILGIPRKGRGVEILRKALVDYGFDGDIRKEKITDHELDAITSALVGKFFLENKYIAIGDPEEKQIIIPIPDEQKQLHKW